MTSTARTPVAHDTADYRDRLEALTGVALRVCPVCHQGQMVAILGNVLTQMTPAIFNTS
jgi:hypothetical protein